MNVLIILLCIFMIYRNVTGYDGKQHLLYENTFCILLCLWEIGERIVSYIRYSTPLPYAQLLCFVGTLTCCAVCVYRKRIRTGLLILAGVVQGICTLGIVLSSPTALHTIAICTYTICYGCTLYKERFST